MAMFVVWPVICRHRGRPKCVKCSDDGTESTDEEGAIRKEKRYRK